MRKVVLGFSLTAAACGRVSAPVPEGRDTGMVVSTTGLVVSNTSFASDVGARILAQGGNAVDAAVATAFALAVTHPSAGNIGRGGFMLVHPPGGSPTVIEYRETAPAAAHKTMYKQGEKPYGPRFTGVPGTVRGMAMAH